MRRLRFDPEALTRLVAGSKEGPVWTTLDRYVLREIGIPFALGLGLFFAVVAFAQVLRVSDAVK